MASKATKKRGAESGKLVNGYLILYNFVQAIGWSYLLLIIAKHYQSPEVGSTSLWGSVKYIVLIFQNAAVLEILHAALGMVSSSVVLTTFQVLSRVMVVCGVLLPTPTGPASPGLPLALVAWSVTEIIRYLYYTCNLLGMQPYLLVWCRYSLFMVLYPVGVTGELLCLYAAQAHVSRTKMWSMEMPNRLNFTFSYHYLLLFIMFLYIPLFPQLYLHMFAQRRKILGSSSKKAQ